jgi:putative ABC transport system permease protein
MFKNYLKIAYRNLLNKNGFSAINVIGLSIGMTCCLLIFQYVAFEYSFDRFHEHKDNIYRVLQSSAENGNELELGHAFTAQALTPALKEGVPEIAGISRVHSEDAIVSDPAHPERVFEDNNILYVDPAFMEMFSFPLTSGDLKKALLPGTALISESAAKKYFNNTKAEGQSLSITGNIDKTYTITGVFKDVPTNSHMQFGILLPVDDLLRGEGYTTEPEGGWSWNNFTTFIMLHPDADRSAVEKKMTQVYLTHRGEVLKQQGRTGALNAQPLTDIHLNSEIQGAGDYVSGSYRTVYFFLVIGLVTLVIALVNYINLATARAVNRSREVGVRKAVGAKRGQLVMQFLAESALTNFTAAVLALTLAAALIPVVNDIAETQLTVTLWMNPGFWIAFSLTVLAGTLLAGLYPAFVLSSFKPSTVLKGRTTYLASHLWLRRSLVVIQFAACIVLLAGTATVYNQLNYMKKMDLGLNLEQVLTVRSPRILPENTDRSTITQTFLQELRRTPGIEQVAVSSSVPGAGFNWNGAAIRKATDDPSAAIRGVATYIDSTFAGLYGLKLVAGQEFADITLSTDENAPWTVILNETATKSLGYASPTDAIDQPLDIGGYTARVIGVYKDFNWSSGHQAQQNIVFGPTTVGRQISIRLSTPDASAVTQKVQSLYEAIFPGNVFSYAFADEAFDRQYRNDQRFAKLFSIAAGMTIFIACLGLFGLVAFTAQQRTKEIGMRKVLGATVTSIVGLLGKDFLKLVLIGFILAVPATWYIMSQWLENFAYRTNISIAVLLLSGAVAMLIALLTVSWQSIKAAIANPVNSLRSE